MTTSYTSDWSERAIAVLHQICHEHRWDPLHLLGVMMNESGCKSTAYNPNGGAAGLIQFMPQTRKNLGWTGSTEAFLNLGVEGQLPFVRRYFAQYATRNLDSAARFYTACFLPATLWKEGSSEPGFVLCAMGGPYEWAYKDNRALDIDKDGRITVADMAAAVKRACRGPRWDELVTRVRAFDGLGPQPDSDADTLPSVPSARAVEPEIAVGWIEPHETAPRLQDEFGAILDPEAED